MGKMKGEGAHSLMTLNLFNTAVLIHLRGRSIIHYHVQNPNLLSEFAFHRQREKINKPRNEMNMSISDGDKSYDKTKNGTEGPPL